MSLISLQIKTSECIDCIQHGIEGDWKSTIACIITLSITGIIRYFEKKHMKKKHDRHAE